MSMKAFLNECQVSYEDRVFTYEDMYECIKRHSTVLDRLNPRKMLLMTFYAFDHLSGIVPGPDKKHWHILNDRTIDDRYESIDVGAHRTRD